ncbi:cupin [Alkalihalophilus pseudofirmus]|uniref:cupin domain-containing protein n=1 Tax=Alkalihalophilus pseudofirmus TaxID=79885 RepID=UPI0009522A99|nr:cupin [Alkalihalophilus pseudofirmus]
MQLFNFEKETGQKVTHFDSNFMMTKIAKLDSPAQIGCMHLGEGGLIGYHQAAVPQLLLIVDGDGWIRSENEMLSIKKGDAVFWEKGEWHETRTDNGLTAISIESTGLNPEEFMVKKR